MARHFQRLSANLKLEQTENLKYKESYGYAAESKPLFWTHILIGEKITYIISVYPPSLNPNDQYDWQNVPPLHYRLRPIKRGQFRFAIFWGKMSLSLSNSLTFAKISLAKIGENGKNCLFLILQLQFHHEDGILQRRYFQLFLSVWSIFSSYTKSAPNEAVFNLF